MSSYSTQAFVFKTSPCGEADALVTLFARGEGKVRVIAKGARRTRSSFTGRLMPLSFNDFLLGRGRDLDVVSQCEIVRSFQKVRDDVDGLRFGLSFISLIDSVLTKGAASEDLFDLLWESLSALENKIPAAAVRSRFALRFLVIEGVGPVLERCVKCNRHIPPHVARVLFSVEERGVVCSQCRQAAPDSAVLSIAGLTLMQSWSAGSLDTSEPQLVRSVDQVLAPLMSHQLGTAQPLYG